jgi:hypothetical protein
MLKKSTKKEIQDFFFSPVFYVILLGLVIVMAMVVTSIGRPKIQENIPSYAVSAPASSGTKNAQQTVSVNILDPNNLAAANNGSTQAATQAVIKKVIYSNDIPKLIRGRALFKIDRFKKLALQPLKFDLFNEKGNLLTPEYLKTVNEQKVHLYVVSADLKLFQHLNPVYENGKWNVSANIPNAGSYIAYSVTTTVKGQKYVSINELIAQEATSLPLKYPGVTPKLLAINDGYQLQAGLNPARAGALDMMNFNITGDGKAVSLRPILGFFTSVVLFQQNVAATIIEADQLAGADDANGLAGVSFDLPTAGKYTAFCEFNLNGKFYTFPITFEAK